MVDKLQELTSRLMDLSDLQMAAGVLRRDQTPYMPARRCSVTRPPACPAGAPGPRKVDQPGYVHIADPLIDQRDYGMTVAALRPIFVSLREHLVPIVQTIAALPPADDACVRQKAENEPRRVASDHLTG